MSDGDIVIAAAAKAPVRDQKELFQNVKIMNNIAEALDNIDLKLFVNVGSDAVYSDSVEPISEISRSRSPVTARCNALTKRECLWHKN